MAGLKRMAGGGGLFLTRYEATGGQGMVTFASKVPGRIFPIDISPGHGYVVHRHGWVCGTPGITPSVALQQTFRGGLWGGEGFILQKLEGEGQAWIELSGEIATYELAAGQSLLVHPGHVGMFHDTVTFSVIRLPGIANRFMGARRPPPGVAHRAGQHLAAVDAAAGAGPGVVGVHRRQRRRARRRPPAGWWAGSSATCSAARSDGTPAGVAPALAGPVLRPARLSGPWRGIPLLDDDAGDLARPDQARRRRWR